MTFDTLLYDVADGVATITLNRPDRLKKRPPRFTGRPSKDMPPFYPWWT